jgi:hypothetical protein
MRPEITFVITRLKDKGKAVVRSLDWKPTACRAAQQTFENPRDKAFFAP